MPAAKTNLQQRLDKEVSGIVTHLGRSEYFPVKNKVSYQDLLSNKMLIILLIRQGIPYSLFELIQQYTSFSDYDWASFLDISTKSLLRYRQSSKSFKPTQSEKIIELAEVTSVGLDVFENMDKFKLWLNTPNFSLGNLKPIELLRDSYGKELVISELTRINHGILA